jgi:hypothetical protein
MRPMIVVAMAGVFWGGTASTALAQRSEAGDRGVRLENDALRTDVRRERLERSATRRLIVKAPKSQRRWKRSVNKQ